MDIMDSTVGDCEERHMKNIELAAHRRFVEDVEAWHRKWHPSYYEEPMPSKPVFDESGRLIGRSLLDESPPLIGKHAEFTAALARIKKEVG